MVSPLSRPDMAPVTPMPMGVRLILGAHLERDRSDAPVTETPMISLTVTSGSDPRSHAPRGVKAIPARASGRKPFSRSFPLEDTSTMVFSTRLETAITGTAQDAGANMQIMGRASRE